MPVVEIKKSNIPDAGNGVFATRNIKKGVNVTEYWGKLLNEKQSTKLEKKGDIQAIYYSSDMGSGKTLVGNMNSKDPERCGQLVNDVMALKNPKKNHTRKC